MSKCIVSLLNGLCRRCGSGGCRLRGWQSIYPIAVWQSRAYCFCDMEIKSYCTQDWNHGRPKYLQTSKMQTPESKTRNSQSKIRIFYLKTRRRTKEEVTTIGAGITSISPALPNPTILPSVKRAVSYSGRKAQSVPDSVEVWDSCARSFYQGGSRIQ